MSARYQNKKALNCLVENVPIVSPKATVGEVINMLTRHARDYSTVAYIYLVNPDRSLVGVVSIRELFIHSHHTLVAVAAKANLITVNQSVSAEQVALCAIDNNLKAVPVIDEKTKRLLGVVPPDVIRDILHYGRTHDALRRAGTEPFEDPKSSLLVGSPILHIRKRLPWLVLGLAGGFVAALIVQQFEAALASSVLVIAFIPLIVYLADAVGSQTEILFVRAIALDPDLRSYGRFKVYFLREIIVSASLALFLGLVMSAITVWWFMAPELVPLIFVSILATLSLSMVVALLIPFLAVRFRYDPALTSGPVATVIRDVLTLVIYFTIVTLFL